MTSRLVLEEDTERQHKLSNRKGPRKKHFMAVELERVTLNRKQMYIGAEPRVDVTVDALSCEWKVVAQSPYAHAYVALGCHVG